MKSTVIIRGGQFEKVPTYVNNIESMAASAVLINLVKRCGETLERHYPNWLWQIQPDEHGGIINIFSLRLNAEYGYTLHVPKLQDDAQLSGVIKAGGEILERFGFQRVAYSYEEWRRREQVHGRFVPNVSDQPIGVRRRERAKAIRAAVDHGAAVICTDPRIGQALKDAKGHLLVN